VGLQPNLTHRLQYGISGCNPSVFRSGMHHRGPLSAVWGVQGVQGLPLALDGLRRSRVAAPSGFESQESQA
jgi:hypothetical protein